MACCRRHECSREPKRMRSTKGSVRRAGKKDLLARLSEFSPGQIRAIAEFEKVSCTFLIQSVSMLALLYLDFHSPGRYDLAFAAIFCAILGLRLGRR
jgi:hypothetical protein